MVEYVGVGLLSSSALVYFWATGLFFFQGRGTPLPFSPPQHFVARGPYRYSRNPMALSVVAGAAGLSLLLAPPAGLLATAVLACVLHRYITRQEEPTLVERFGGPYVAYCERVPRWLFGASAPRRAAA